MKILLMKLIVLLIGLAMSSCAMATDVNSLINKYSQNGKIAPSIKNGESFFNNKHGKDWSCATCHGTPPTSIGKHAVTDKPIQPMAPALNPERLTDEAKVEKWFRRNCNDVVGRECTDSEKVDVLAYLNSIKK